MNCFNCFQFLFILLLYSCVCLPLVLGSKQSQPTRLHFKDEPESQLSRADGSKIVFKCTASPPEANIKWLRNGSIIKNDEYEWIKVNGNKLVLKLHKSLHSNHSDHHNHNPHHHHQHHHHQSSDQKSQSITSSNEVYQCLAELGSQVIVSQPAKLIIAELNPFEHHENISVTVIAGNTAVIPCDLPSGIPFVISEFEFGNITIAQSYDRYRLVPSGSLQIFNAKPSDSGAYRCVAHNPYLQEKLFAYHFVNLKVVKHRHVKERHLKELHFDVKPKEVTNSILGQNITIECVASGHPLPKMYWERLNGDLPKKRNLVDGGNLHITTLEKADEGTYVCKAVSGKGNTIVSSTNLEVSEIPQIVNNDLYEMLDAVEGQELYLVCEAKGFPKPFITWLHNGYIIDPKDSSASGFTFNNDETVLKITRVNAKLHSGIFQCFATNQLGSTYSIKIVNVRSSADLSNRDQQTSQHHHPQTSVSFAPNTRHRNSQVENKLNREESDEDGDLFLGIDQNVEANGAAGGGGGVRDGESANHNHNNNNNSRNKKAHKKGKHNKNLKMIPPNPPVVSKLNDDSVMVRWSLSNHSGLPIKFFKVQYREAGKSNGSPSIVITENDEIPAHIFSYSVSGLNPNSKYRFRIAAVYANDNNGHSAWTKFSFPHNNAIKKPSLPPTIVSADALSQTEIELHWEFLNIDEVPIEGFFIFYRKVDNAGEFLKATSPEPSARQQNITHLEPGTSYEFKMSSFNPSGTSTFSNIYKVKTLPPAEVHSETPKPPVLTPPASYPPPLPLPNMQLIVILMVVGALIVLVCFVICIIRCKSQAPASKVIKKGKPLKSSTSSDYYFNSTNVYDRRANGQLASMAAAASSSLSRNTLKPAQAPTVAASASETDGETRPLNNNNNNNHIRLNALHEMSSLNRKNSFRNSLSTSTHHLFNSATSNGKPPNFEYTSSNEQGTTTPAPVSTATIDRKRMMKSCVEPYLDPYSRHHQPPLNNHSTSFTRLNGTLERKRRSRTDLSTLDRSYLRNNISTNEMDRPPNGNAAAFLGPPQNGPIVIMQSSC